MKFGCSICWDKECDGHSKEEWDAYNKQVELIRQNPVRLPEPTKDGILPGDVILAWDESKTPAENYDTGRQFWVSRTENDELYGIFIDGLNDDMIEKWTLGSFMKLCNALYEC